LNTLEFSGNPLFYDCFWLKLSFVLSEDFCVSTNCQFDLGCRHRFGGWRLPHAIGDAMAAPAFSESDWAICLCCHRLDGDAAQTFFASHWALGYGQSGRGMVDEIEPCHSHVGAHRHTSGFLGYFGGQSVWGLALAGVWPQCHYFALHHLVLGAA
jgi:hypothetical protein